MPGIIPPHLVHRRARQAPAAATNGAHTNGDIPPGAPQKSIDSGETLEQVTPQVPPHLAVRRARQVQTARVNGAQSNGEGAPGFHRESSRPHQKPDQESPPAGHFTLDHSPSPHSANTIPIEDDDEELEECFEDQDLSDLTAALKIAQPESPVNGGPRINGDQPDRKQHDTGIHEHSPDDPIPSIEDVARDAHRSTWLPCAVAGLPLVDKSNIPDRLHGFTKEFIIEVLGGEEWSHGLYYNPRSLEDVLPSHSYYIISREFDPYLPKVSGNHGARLTTFFNDSEVEDGKEPGYAKVPLFVGAANGRNEYVYLGDYSQVRWSDKLDHDTMTMRVPAGVKMFWAEWLTRSTRPDWVTEQLKEHFWPKPTFHGALKTDSRGKVQIEEMESDLLIYLNNLKYWQKDAEQDVKNLTVGDILNAFEKPTVDDGLRLQWEYLQCVGFNNALYTTMAKLQTQDHNTDGHVRI